MKIVHVSDIHFWRYSINPLHLMSKRLFGMAALALGRARRFRLERVAELVARVNSLDADHLLITGDMTTTALPAEFRAATEGLKSWLLDPRKVTILPGNHDRYTVAADRGRVFERHFGAYAPASNFPWLRALDASTAILGLDPCRAGWTASGRIPTHQLERARELLLAARRQYDRVIVACHYPVSVPAEFARVYAKKPLVNAAQVAEWLRTAGPHLFCCGHVHSAWAFRPAAIPDQLCLNAGAPLLHDAHIREAPGFLEIQLNNADIYVRHHGYADETWHVTPLWQQQGFFNLNGAN